MTNTLCMCSFIALMELQRISLLVRVVKFGTVHGDDGM